MTDPSETNPQSESQPPKKRFPKWRLTLAVLLLTGVAGSWWWGWRFVHLQLAPLLSRELAKLFDRPVRVGDLESFSLTHVRFGTSQIPETPEHPSSAELDAVSVRFNPLSIVWGRTLNLDISIEDPQLTLSETRDGQWVTTQIRTGGEPGFVKIQLNSIEVRNGTVTLQAQPKFATSSGKTIGKAEPKRAEPLRILPTPVVLRRLTAEADFEDDGRIAFDATGYHNIKERLNVRGEYSPGVEGESSPSSAGVRLNLSAQSLQGNVVSPWIPAPIDLDGGEIFGNLLIQIPLNAPGELPNLQGNMRFRDVDLQIDGVPQTIVGESGRLRFRDVLIGLEEVSGKYGEVPVQIPQGALSLERGYEIPMQVPPVEWQVVQKSIDVEFPVEVTGEVEALLKLVGPLETPVLIGEGQTTDIAIVDRIPFSDVTARFVLAAETSEFVIEQLNAVPEGGGQVQAAVKVLLPQTLDDAPQVLAEFLVRDASADAIASRYDVPTTSAIGTLNARGIFESNRDGSIVRLPSIDIAGGQARGGILFVDDRWQIELATADVSLNSFFPQDFVQTFALGRFNGQVVLVGDSEVQTLSDIEAQARGTLDILDRATDVQAALTFGRWETAIVAQQLSVPASLLPDVGFLPETVSGSLQLAGDLSYFENPDLANLEAATSLTTSILGNPTRLDGQLIAGQWQAEIASEGLPVAPFIALPPELAALNIGAFAGRAKLTGTLATLENPSLANIEVLGSGRLAVENGSIDLDVRVADGQIEGSAIGRSIDITSLLPVSELGSIALTGQVNFAGNAATFSPETLNARGQFGLVAHNGIAEATFQLADGQWSIESHQFVIPLEPFVDAPIALTPLQNLGKVARLSGSVSDLRPEAISGEFLVGFSFAEAIDPKTEPSELGRVAIDATLENGRWQTRVTAQNAEIAAFLPAVPSKIVTADLHGKLGGTILLSGTWNGFTPAEIEVGNGEIQLANLRLNDTVFDPLLVGSIESDETGVKVQLEGIPLLIDDEPDEISVWLDRNLTLREFSIDLDDAEASGNLENDVFRLQLDAMPLSLLPIRPFVDRGPLNGRLSLLLDADLAANRATGEVFVADPALGLVTAEALQGNFFWSNNTLLLQDIRLGNGESLYALDSRIDIDDDPNIEGSIEIRDGQTQDILEALRWFEIADLARGLASPTYANAEALDVSPVGLPESPLLVQLYRLAEIDALLGQQRRAREEASPLPELADLQGAFSGTVNFTGSVQSGVDFDFDLRGESWQWDEYRIHEIATSGTFEDGLWQLEPSQVRVNLSPEVETQFNFSGLIGGRRQSAQFQLDGLPISVLSEFVSFPPSVRLQGSVSGSATLAGSFENPQARGEFHWLDGQINQQPVRLARGGFSYDDARLNLGGQIVLLSRESSDSDTPSQPIVIDAKLPVELPGATVQPDDETFRVELEAVGNGLILLDALTADSLQWGGGEGAMRLTLSGERRGGGFNYVPLSTTGIAEFRDAVFYLTQLPEPLTQVNGSIEFDNDRIRIPQLTGEFRQGSVRATGTLPLLSALSTGDLLLIDLDRVALNLKGLYRGTIEGAVFVNGSVLYPELAGQLRLADGQIFIPDPSTASSAVASEPSIPYISYNGLTLELDRNLQIVSPPLLNFIADGQLLLDGTFDRPEPQGTIFLRDGQVNLFTTTFTLARGENTASFIPPFGSDPVLSVRLRAAVQETTRPRIASPAEVEEAGTAAEIVEPAIERGAVETVRIEARVRGRASRLFENLELTSSPARSQTEIYSLIGGGALGTAGQQDTSLVVASSALLTQVQSILGRALGYRDFRLFPAVDPRTSALGLGAEVGINLTDDLSVSVLTILDRDDSTRFSVRYRIDDNWLIRGSTNFDSDNRGIIEYQLRF
ncbi:MAG: translocation/assembly module TamB [Cyanobacteria bacterium SID2]|nr:translocation/assembly module TamB [Cyanobacteria bacterium SID2]MBP0003376.1 translocation/assembly module TamB [Cyanobacteria bacterium SBC]